MSDRSAIEWTEATWNPTTGCDRVSPGCDNCYALTLAKRLKAMDSPKYQADGDPRTSGPGFGLTLHPDALAVPYGWKSPRTVFVNSMSDLFHARVPLDYVRRVFEVMSQTPQHTYQVLTKRARRLRQVADRLQWPANLWMGVSVESAKELPRVDDLRQVPATVKFLSCEPLLGPLDGLELTGIDWVIAGGESGPGHRPLEEAWVTQIRDTCQDAGVAFFFKLLCTTPVPGVRSRSAFRESARFTGRQRSRTRRGWVVANVDSRASGDQFGRFVSSVSGFGQVTFREESEGRGHPLDGDRETRSATRTVALGCQKAQSVLSFDEVVEPLLKDGLVGRSVGGDLVAVTGGSGQRVEDAVVGSSPLVPAPRCSLVTRLSSFRQGRTDHSCQCPQRRTNQTDDRRCHCDPPRVEVLNRSGSKTCRQSRTFGPSPIVAVGGRS
ncbi:DUF5131 family protein [Streptomyces canus]|uniref:DUF5131 family protein n=1 Tax=Streptomyces canus TaxID=58343 RepID=UPI0036CE319B